MSFVDPFEKSLSTSLNGMFFKKENEVLRRILDSPDVFANKPLDDNSHKREHNQPRRRVFRIWPRAPKGPSMRVSSVGKRAPTATPLWGARLSDFFYVNRVPNIEGLLTISTGSKLAGWMKALDDSERPYASDEIAWASCEPDPEVRHASDIRDIIESRDLMVMLRVSGVSLRDDEWAKDEEPEEGVGKMDQADEGMDVDDETTNKMTEVADKEDTKIDASEGGTTKTDKAMDVEDGASDKQEQSGEAKEKKAAAYTPPKPFDYANYPMPWPLVPFSSNPPTLESPIPYHLLPEKLIVHDPFRLLHATDPQDLSTHDSNVNPEASCDSDTDSISNQDSVPEPELSHGTDWKTRPDITHTYSLHLKPSVKEDVMQERTKIAKAAAHADADPIVLLTLYFYNPEGPVRTGVQVEVTVPPPPPPPSCTPEAHLYIEPAEIIGKGNHSFVYRAEWDLPRSVFFKPTICETCVKETAQDIIRKREGEMKEGDASLSNMGRFVERTKHFPSLSINFVKADEARKECEDPLSSWCSTTPPDRVHTYEPGQSVTYTAYEGPKTRVHVDSVPWYTPGVDPEPCSHRVPAGGPLPGPSPPSAQVSVVAKISKPGDLHLDREAVNYQRFGPHMSEHWTGYTVARPIQNPTPVGAIVPNFYGYYVKDIEQEDEIVIPGDCKPYTLRAKYFSPILLLEDCGNPINPSELSLDDRHECAALLLRFHHLGWTQGSFFDRNILTLCGDHTKFPLMRSLQEKRFRLIDFGRAICREDAKDEKEWNIWDSERFEEKSCIWKILGLPYHT